MCGSGATFFKRHIFSSKREFLRWEVTSSSSDPVPDVARAGTPGRATSYVTTATLLACKTSNFKTEGGCSEQKLELRSREKGHR